MNAGVMEAEFALRALTGLIKKNYFSLKEHLILPAHATFFKERIKTFYGNWTGSKRLQWYKYKYFQTVLEFTFEPN